MSKVLIGPESKSYTLSNGMTISGGPGGLKNLRSLHLGYTPIVDQDLKMIGTLCGDNLVSLDISGCTGISDSTIESLRKSCRNLHCLYIYDTDLTDACITKWANSKECSLKKFGPGRGISPGMIQLLASRGVEVAEATDQSLLTDAVSSFFCGFTGL